MTSAVIVDVIASRTASAPCPARARPFLTLSRPRSAMRGRWSSIVNRVVRDVAARVVRMAVENPQWGYTRIRGALSNLGHEIARTTVKRILHDHGIVDHSRSPRLGQARASRPQPSLCLRGGPARSSSADRSRPAWLFSGAWPGSRAEPAPARSSRGRRSGADGQCHAPRRPELAGSRSLPAPQRTGSEPIGAPS